MRLINSILSKFGLVIISKQELTAFTLTVENKALLEEKISMWYKLYKGENFKTYFGLE